MFQDYTHRERTRTRRTLPGPRSISFYARRTGRAPLPPSKMFLCQTVIHSCASETSDPVTTHALSGLMFSTFKTYSHPQDVLTYMTPLVRPSAIDLSPFLVESYGMDN